jgi:methylmalonyl-CoA mutase
MNPQPISLRIKSKNCYCSPLLTVTMQPINIMRRIIQSTGVEVIHLGHDRSVEEVEYCYSRRCK